MNTLTLEEFARIPNGAVIASGMLPNSPGGLYMTNNRLNDPLIWVAVKGYGNDWAIYCHWEESGLDYTQTSGDKIHSEEHIKRCIPCTDEVYRLYRW